MAGWGRNTPWRQGHALTTKSSVALGLVPEEGADSKLVIVISHDCDLAQLPDSEPCIEIIVARRVNTDDGNCTHAKNPRRLHLPYKISGETTWWELSAPSKTSISKQRLADHAPNDDALLDVKSKAILRRWLAARYNRGSFPDEFVERLQAHIGERITKIVKPAGNHLIAVFFDIDEGEEKERCGAADVYDLYVYLLYNTQEDEVAAHEAVEKAAAEITKTFCERCCPGGDWQWIKLQGCEAISDNAMPYALSAYLKPWDMDYLSFRGDGPPGPMLQQ
jgi:hypothetical protein